MLKQPFHWMYILTDSTNLENTMLQCQICSLQSLKLITKNRRLVGKWFWVPFGLFTKRRTCMVCSPNIELELLLYIHQCYYYILFYIFIVDNTSLLLNPCTVLHISCKKKNIARKFPATRFELARFLSPFFLNSSLMLSGPSYNLQMYNAFIKKWEEIEITHLKKDKKNAVGIFFSNHGIKYHNSFLKIFFIVFLRELNLGHRFFEIY